MGYEIDRLDFILKGVFRVVWYRSLHMVSVPVPPKEFLAYAKEHTSGGGDLRGTLQPIHSGPFLEFWRWNDMVLGRDLTMNMYFFGAHRGAQTVLVRDRFWRGNFSPRTVRLLADPLGLILNGNGAGNGQ